MRGKTGALTASALLAALSVALLSLTLLLPTQRLTLLCAASLAVAASRCLSGEKWALGVYAVSALLSLLLLPEKSVPLAYALFCGYYPLVKLRLETLSLAALRFCAKLLVFNAAALVLLALIKAVTPLPVWTLLLCANGAFALYDYALSKLILLYSRKIAGRIKHG